MAQRPTGQTAGESAVVYRSTCLEGKNPLTSRVRAIKNTLPTHREPREGAPSPLRRLDLTARQGKTRLLALSRRRLRIIKRSPMRPDHAKWHRTRERPRKAAPGAAGAQRDPMPTIGERHRSCRAALGRLARGRNAHAAIPRSNARRHARRPRKTVAAPPHPLLPPRLQESSRCMPLNRLCQLFGALTYC